MARAGGRGRAAAPAWQRGGRMEGVARLLGGRGGGRRGGGEWKVSLVFWGAGAERPGWLVRCLDEFARRDINLTKIESRPLRRELGSYMFFADISGNARDPPAA